MPGITLYFRFVLLLLMLMRGLKSRCWMDHFYFYFAFDICIWIWSIEGD